MDDPSLPIPVRIAAALARLENEHNVEILFASESGSRAWGMASPNSDYDVRGVFRPRSSEAATTESLQRLFHRKTCDQIDYMSEDRMLDISLWSVHKALSLADTGNTMLLEWLRSPIVYHTTGGWMEMLTRQLQQGGKAARTSTLHHFFGFLTSALNQITKFDKDDKKEIQGLADAATQAVNAYKQAAMVQDWAKCAEEKAALDTCLSLVGDKAHTLKTPAPPEIKKLCYIVRPALYLEYMHQHGVIPPLDLNEVLRGLDLPDDLFVRVERLLAAKRASREKALCEDADAVIE